MRIKPVKPISYEELQAVDGETRSEGLHLSTIIKDMLRRRLPKVYGRPIDATTVSLWEAGFVWEELAGRAMARRYSLAHDSTYLLYQLELSRNDIYMTLDLLRLARSFRPRMLHEFKFTKISARNDIHSNRFWHWKVQSMAYCLAAGVCQVRFDVLFANGYYEKGMFGAVQPKAWVLTYSPQELRRNWRMILLHRDLMRKEKLIA